VSGLYILWETGYAVFRFIRLQAGVVEYRIDWTDYLLFLFLLWPAVVCIREVYRLMPTEGNFWARLTMPWRRPADRQARALRDFSLVFLLVAGLSIFNILRTFYLLPVALANTGIAIGVLFALFIFALAYLNQRTETTSFMVKLAGITLTVMLAIMSGVGWVITPAHTADFHYDLSALRALRFTPETNGGYRIDAIPYAFETAPGYDLHLDDGLQRGCSEALDFAFPFYGQAYREVYICNDGVISLGQPVRYRELQYHYGAGTSLLMPLLLDLDPTISPGGVFARQAVDHANTGDRLIITWERLRGYRQPQAEFTFQAALYADGRFDFIYAELPERLTFRPNDDPGASLWAIGALPGNLHSPGQATLTGNLPVHSGPEGIIQDFHLDFRRHLQRLLAPVAGLILVASAFIAGGFPLLFYVSLVGPLNTLLKGAQRIEGGEYNFVMPEQAPDEIGVLTRMFNSLTTQVGDLINTLEARVASRTAALDTANAQLRAEIVEREQAQMTLLEQQRLLARYEERETMGRELHDGLGQVMGYINVQAQAAQTFLQNGQIEAAQNALADLIPAAQDAHTDIRAHILGLRAREKAPQDYLNTLRDPLEQFGRQHHITTRLSTPEPFPPAIFAPAVEEQVARILQEGLANIRKHARARRVEVTISFIGDYVQIVLADDGIGFEPDYKLRITNGKWQMANPQSLITNPQSPIISACRLCASGRNRSAGRWKSVQRRARGRACC